GRDTRSEEHVAPAAVGGEEAEKRPQTLATGRERLRGDGRRVPLAAPDRLRQPRLQLRHVGGKARCRVDGERVHPARPVCSATIDPASNRKRTSANPARSSSEASSSAAGSRATE